MKVESTTGQRLTPTLAEPAPSGFGPGQVPALTDNLMPPLPTAATSADLVELEWADKDSTELIGFIQKQSHHIHEAAVLAHDMKSPLAAIATSAELLELEMAGEDASHLIGVIQRQAIRLQHMVQDLAESMRMPDGGLKLCCELIDFNQLVHELANESRRIVRSHNLRVNLPAAPVMANVDVEKVRRIFQNLLCNAIQYSPKGTTITVGLWFDHRLGSAVLLIEDEGPGVPESAREEVFKPFVRLKSDCSGEGLGLHIVRRFAADHEGEAWVEAGAVGARFCVSLPIEVPTSDLLGQLGPNRSIRTRRHSSHNPGKLQSSTHRGIEPATS